MATNKHAIIRYKVLDKCFRNTGRNYSFNNLLDTVNDTLSDFDPDSNGIQTRQLRDDIAFMKSDAGYNAPIETIREGKSYYYRYEDSKFSINNSPLNATEAEQLKSALSVLQRFEGAPQFEWMSEVSPMLSNQFGFNNSEKKIIAYDSNIDYTGYEHISPLFNAISNKSVINITYKPFDKDAFSITFHPYYLKQYNNRWFVTGYNAELCNPKWIFALDRIQAFSIIDGKYIENDIDWEEDYFFNVIGVTVPEGETETVELLFTKEQASYIQTKPLHPTQKGSLLENGELHVRLNIIPNYELETKILSFGEKVKVLKPEKLRKRIIERVRSIIEKY